MKEFIEKLIGRLEEWSFETEIVIPGSDGYDDTENREIICTKNAIEIVKELADEHNNGWIPCSERLPEKGQGCLVTDKDGGMCCTVYIDYIMTDFKNGQYIAWMPFPEPYQQKGE